MTEETKTNFYESVFYSIGVVGVNTTAMIESAIIGKCVFSVLAPEFNESQSNTIHHFSYLRQENGGMLFLSNNLDEHVGHLKDILQNEESKRSLLAEFVKHFARPHGINKPGVPILAHAIENAWQYSPISASAVCPAPAVQVRAISCSDSCEAGARDN